MVMKAYDGVLQALHADPSRPTKQIVEKTDRDINRQMFKLDHLFADSPDRQNRAYDRRHETCQARNFDERPGMVETGRL